MHKLKANKTVLQSNHVLIVTTNTYERDAVLNELECSIKLTTGSKSKRAYLGLLQDTFVVVLDGSGGYSDPNSASRMVQAYLADQSYPLPYLAVPVGVCWGNPVQVCLEEVVVATRVISANRMTETDGERKPRSYDFDSSVDAEVLEDLLEGVRFGALLSMETRLSSEAARDEWIERFPSILGGEMEGFSIAPACQDLPWVIVKGVSDFGTSNESRSAQRMAASNAMLAAVRLLQGFPRNTHSELDDMQLAASELLSQALRGSLISIKLSELDAANINRSLHPYFAKIEAAIRVHTAALAVASELACEAARLIFEVASNAFRHGRARSVSIEFVPNEIRYTDDASAFDVGSLEGRLIDGRGGRSTYISFIRRYDGNAKVSLRYEAGSNGNSLRVGITSEITGLPEIAFKCRAEVDYTMLRQRGEVLRWPDECEDIFLDFDAIVVTSIILDLCEELVRPLAQGKRFVILCSRAEVIEEICQRYPDQIGRGDVRFVPSP